MPQRGVLPSPSSDFARRQLADVHIGSAAAGVAAAAAAAPRALRKGHRFLGATNDLLGHLGNDAARGRSISQKKGRGCSCCSPTYHSHLKTSIFLCLSAMRNLFGVTRGGAFGPPFRVVMAGKGYVSWGVCLPCGSLVIRRERRKAMRDQRDQAQRDQVFVFASTQREFCKEKTGSFYRGSGGGIIVHHLPRTIIF